MWTFQTDPEYQAKLDWAEEFMRTRDPSQHIPAPAEQARELYAETMARHGR